MRIFITVCFAGAVRELQVVYPDRYPYFRFWVYAPPELALRRHQHPVTGQLCVLDQGTIHWTPNLLAADVIAEQLPKIEETNAAAGASALEIAAPEPASMYFMVTTGSCILLPPEAYTIDPSQAAGELTLALTNSNPPLRGYVEAVDGTRATLPPLNRAFQVSERRTAHWYRIPTPRATTAQDIETELMRTGVLQPPTFRPGRPLEIIALLFDEEVEYPGVVGPGWTFLVRRRQPPKWTVELLRVERYDREALLARIKPISHLATRRVVQFGIGGLGAPSAHLLAESRLGDLRMVDADAVSLGISVRWPLGVNAVGLPKGYALTDFFAAQYPETRVEASAWHVGAGNVENEDELEERALAGADLIFDATAELGVQQFLADRARERGIPFVIVEATEGGYGGIVALFRPGREQPCWLCLQFAIADGAIVPPRDFATGHLQLAGCATSTFTGAAFDLVPLAAQAVRLIAYELSPAGAPRPAWTVAVLWNRENDAGDIGLTPRWQYLTLARHPQCRAHD